MPARQRRLARRVVPLLTQIEALWPTDDVLSLMGGAIHYQQRPSWPSPWTACQPRRSEMLLLYKIPKTRRGQPTRAAPWPSSSTIAAAQRSLAPRRGRQAHDSRAATSRPGSHTAAGYAHLAGLLEADLPSICWVICLSNLPK